MGRRTGNPAGRPLKDRSGQHIGQVQVLELSHRKGKSVFWKCLCDCGNSCVVSSAALSLTIRKTVSCGCYKKARLGKASFIDGRAGTQEYKTYHEMIKRCTNPNHKAWPDYGGRGITICDRWIGPNGFKNFLADMGPKPEGDYSIERDDTDGNYGPENCRWATKIEQANNKRTNTFLEFSGERHTMAEWERIRGFPEGILSGRISRQGWSIERALTDPPKHQRRGSANA